MKKILILILAVTLSSCIKKMDYTHRYPVGTKFNYNGSLAAIGGFPYQPTNPFTIDSIDMNVYARGNESGWVGYKVKSANGLYMTMSDSNIGEVVK